MALTRDVHPEAVRHSGRDSLPKAEGVPTDEVSALTVWVIQGVEEVGR